MAVSADGRFSLSAAGQLRGAMGLAGRNSRLEKYGNGEVMGNKLKLNKLHQGANSTKFHKQQRICMSLTADVVGESKVSQAPPFFNKHTH